MDVRSLFPALDEYTYLNHASLGPLSTRVQQAVSEAAALQALGSEAIVPLAARVPELKRQIADLINASPDEIALVRNTVEGLATVASGIMWREGDNVVTDNIEFPANIYCWLNLKSRFGVSTKIVPAQGGRVVAEDLMAACDQHTRVLTVSFVQFSNGYRADIERLGAFCRARGIRFCVDAIQGLGPLQIDVCGANIDFLAAGGHKWLLSPIGIGFLYVRKAVQPEVWPSEIGHLGVLQNTDRYTEYNLTFRPTAEKFEGGVPNYLGVFGLNESLKLIHSAGLDRVEAATLALTDHLAEALTGRGYRLLAPRGPAERSGTVAFVSDRIPSAELFNQLTAAKVIVSLREDAIRVAPFFYNTHEEIDRLLAVLPRERPSC